MEVEQYGKPSGQVPFDLFLNYADAIPDTNNPYTQWVWNLGRAVEGYKRMEVLDFVVNTEYYPLPPFGVLWFYALQIHEVGQLTSLQTSKDYTNNSSKTVAPTFIIPAAITIANANGFGGLGTTQHPCQVSVDGLTLNQLTCTLSDQDLGQLPTFTPVSPFYLYLRLRFYK